MHITIFIIIKLLSWYIESKNFDMCVTCTILTIIDVSMNPNLTDTFKDVWLTDKESSG